MDDMIIVVSCCNDDTFPCKHEVTYKKIYLGEMTGIEFCKFCNDIDVEIPEHFKVYEKAIGQKKVLVDMRDCVHSDEPCKHRVYFGDDGVPGEKIVKKIMTSQEIKDLLLSINLPVPIHMSPGYIYEGDVEKTD